jgi:hypothetical protein
MDQLPSILGCNPIDHLSFYQLEDICQCRLKGLLRLLILNHPMPEAPPSKGALVGIFHHAAMEFAIRVHSLAELDEQIAREINNLRSIVSKWPHLRKHGNVSAWDDINKSASLAMRVLLARSSSKRSLEQRPETTLHSSNGIMMGRPDYFSIDTEVAYLREYKSTPIRDEEGRPIEAHLRQVRFYSTLLFENYPIRQVQAKVESLSGDSYDVQVCRAESDQLLNDVASLRTTVNIEIAATKEMSSLATPTEENCRYCNGQIICQAFKHSNAKKSGPQRAAFVEGTVVNASPLPRDYSVSIQDTYRKSCIEVVVPTPYSVGFHLNQRYAFQNLVLRDRDATWSNETRVFSCD